MKSRTYRMSARAEQVDETRKRIVEAAVELHGSVGPARTTIAGIAERAGVTRVTVYRHFPDEDTLFAACSAHWLAGQRPPNPAAWAQHADPEERVRAGLSDLYRFYRDGAAMLSLVNADKEVLPASRRDELVRRDQWFADSLLAAFPRPRKQLRAVVGHAVSFWTWRSLCEEQGLSNKAAVDAMTTLIVATASL